MSASDTPVTNSRDEDDRKSTAASQSSRRRSRSREKRRERSSSPRHRSHKERGEREKDYDYDRRRGDRESHRRRRSRSPRRDHDRDYDRRRDRDDRGERDRDRERDREHRRRKRDESADGERHPDSKRRRDDSGERKDKMDVEKEPMNGNRSSPVSPGTSERQERERRSPSRRSGRERGSEYRSPRHDDRDRYRDRDYDRRPRSRAPPDHYEDRRRPYDRDYPPRREPPRQRRPSPGYDALSGDQAPQDDDSEARSVFVSQLAARLTARDLGYFFEDKLGEGSVRDSRIVTDRISRRSKGIAYVELASIDLIQKAIALTGTVVMGLPIMVQLTESERNKQAPAVDSLNLPPGVNAPPVGMQLYVGSLHFNLTESDIKQVFEPFGELDFVDLHKDPQTGRSKGYAFVQYKRAEDAKMALEQMDGFELAGRQLRVNTVHDKGSTRGIMGGIQQDSLDEGGGTNLNSVSRQALMQKLARTEPPASRPAPIMRPTNIPTAMKSSCILLKNMFDPEEETEADWHKDLQADVKDECEAKYGKVEAIKVEVESQGEIYVRFATVEEATKAIDGLNGRWFGGNQVSAAYISDVIMNAHL